MLNHITIMGRLTRDVELRHTQQGTPVASFTVAVERDFQSGGERQTDFIDCVAWRHTAEFVSKYFQKGSMAVVCGRLESRRWEDKNGGKRTNWEIIADNIYFGENQGGEQIAARIIKAVTGRSDSVSPNVQFEELEGDESDLPF